MKGLEYWGQILGQGRGSSRPLPSPNMAQRAAGRAFRGAQKTPNGEASPWRAAEPHGTNASPTGPALTPEAAKP